MAIIVETGAIIASANSYVSVADVRAYATARNKSLPATDIAVEVLIIQAVDYLEAKRESYKGYKVNPSLQVMQWPRANVLVDGFLIPTTTIPTELKNAECELVCVQYGTNGTDGVNLFPNQTGKFTLSEKVDVLEVTYSDKLRTSGTPQLTSVMQFLAPLLRGATAGASIPLSRV